MYSSRFGDEVGYFECFSFNVTNLKLFLDQIASIKMYFLLKV